MLTRIMEDKLTRLDNKVAIITGAGFGIGQSVAMLFAKEGANVVVGARRLENLESMKSEAKIIIMEEKIIPVAVDVSSEDDLKKLVDTTMDEFGTVDILVNNAGILDEYSSLENLEDDLWLKVFDVNVNSIMRLTRLVIPIMRKNKSGSIINTASVGGLYGMRGGLDYVASKHAVVGMTKHIGYAYADEGIRCNAVVPGSVSTDTGTKVKNPDKFTLDKLMKGVELFQHFAKPDDLAKTYLYLASDDAVFTNGTVLVADGGWTAY